MTPVKLGVYVSGRILQEARGQAELACILAHLCDPGQVTSLLSEPQFLHLETRKGNTVVPPLWGFGGMCVVLSLPAAGRCAVIVFAVAIIIQEKVGSVSVGRGFPVWPLGRA